jgi:5-methylcytosine-specific restriction protein A
MAGRWWEADSRERYWLEATDREDIGVDLRAPLVDASGQDNWRYTLFRETMVGDVVFHYDSRHTNGIIGWSRVAAAPEPTSILWKARGSYARERGAVAEELPGYRVPLEGYTRLQNPLTLTQLRAARSTLVGVVEAGKARGKPVQYFPFELSERRDVRPMQGYAFKLPAAFVEAFPQLQGVMPGAWIGPLDNDHERVARNPPWSRDELILALDLYRAEFIPPLNHSSKELVELSQLLGRMARALGRSPGPDYRNANGVYMKLMNFRRFDPAFADAGKKGLSRGNKEEAVVWAEFAEDRSRLAATAAAIRAAVIASDSGDLAAFDEDGIEEAAEGTVLTRLHRVRERNRQLIETRKMRELKKNGRLRCEVCFFDFQNRYGERGRNFIEAHHTKPVHTLTAGEKTQLADLALVCANCHRMIHARRPWLSIVELRALIGHAVTEELGVVVS